jgi:hypothetical protein
VAASSPLAAARLEEDAKSRLAPGKPARPQESWFSSPRKSQGSGRQYPGWWASKVLEEFPWERLPRGNWPRKIAGIPTGSWAAKVGLRGEGKGETLLALKRRSK